MASILRMAAAEQGKLNTGMRRDNQHHLKTTLLCFLLGISPEQNSVCFCFLLSLYQQQSGVENIARPCPQSENTWSLPIARGGLKAMPIWERRYKDNKGKLQTLKLSWEKSRDCGLLLTGEKKKWRNFLKWKKMVLAPVFTCNRCQLLIEHPHWCWWWHHPHESPHRGACSGRSTRLLLLCCSLSLLLLSNFSCPLCKGISDFQFCF